MKAQTLKPSFAAGIVCIVLGIFAWSDFIGEVSSGDLDLLNFETLLFPVGVGLIKPGLFWRWVARIQLFALALFSGTLLVGFLFMSEETKFLVFELNSDGGSFSGVGIVLVLHTLFFSGILWVYFSMFASKRESSSSMDINVN